MKDYAEKVASFIRDLRPELQVAVYGKGMPDGSKQYGVTVRANGACIAPTIYTDDMKKHDYSVERAAKEVLALYDEHKVNGKDLDMDWFMDFEQVKKKLTVRLLPKTFNAEIFRSAKRYGFDDLILVPYVKVENELFGNGSILVKEDHIAKWGVTEKEVLDKAIANTKKEEVEVKPMSSFLGMLGAPAGLFPSENEPVVLSTVENVYGASAILAKMKELKDKYTNGFYVIPSSVHEVIVIPKADDNMMSIDFLTEMVKEVNATTVAAEDVLSNKAYAFV